MSAGRSSPRRLARSVQFNVVVGAIFGGGHTRHRKLNGLGRYAKHVEKLVFGHGKEQKKGRK